MVRFVYLLPGPFLLALLLATASLAQAPGAGLKEVSEDVKVLVQGNNEFALDLYRRLAKREGNVLFSPYSVSTALAMTYAGARGETAEQMARVLHFSMPQGRLHPAFGELVGGLQKEPRDCHFHVANSLWGQTGYPFRDAFVRLTQKNYHAGLDEVDFKRDPEEARKAINGWVEERTQDKIRELLLRGDVTPETRLVLANAVYFKAAWKLPFPKGQTKGAAFHASATETPTVAMMRHPEGLFRYFADDDLQWLELPYKGDRLSMVLLLPQKKRSLNELEKTLTASAVQRGLARLHARVGDVSLPRFQLTSRCSLAEELKEMGMPLPFSRGADFSGLVSNSAERLRINGVIHKAYVDVDEVGTEAAAATAVVIGGTTLIRPFFFRADRPFMFLIRDSQTGIILFVGRVIDPRC